MANHDHEQLDANCVAKRLWVGSKPPFDRDLPQFQTLVLCAAEIQPPTLGFRGHVLRARLRDDYPTIHEIKIALTNGREVAKHLAAGKTVLVTCSAGRNRSALVAGLAIGLLTTMSATEIMAQIRQHRDPSCLYNQGFQQVLEKYIGAGRGKPMATPEE